MIGGQSCYFGANTVDPNAADPYLDLDIELLTTVRPLGEIVNILSAPIAAKIAVAIFAGAIVVGGSAAASAAVGEVINEVIAATEETPVVDEEVEEPPVDDGTVDDETDGEEAEDDVAGPDATGKAAWGLCNARSHGGLPEHSTAGAALDAAGEGDTEGYCETVTKNGHDDEAEDEGDEGEADGDDADSDEDADATTEQSHGDSGNHGNGNGNGHKKGGKKR